jgi:hypothetical protein
MKYKEREQLLADLRSLSEFYERPESIALPKPSLDFSDYVGNWRWIDGEYTYDPEESKAKLKRIVHALGSCKKDWQNGNLAVSKAIGNSIRLRFTISREAVCKKVPTGETKVIPSQYIPERIEEGFEWVCEDVSLLA